MKSKTLIAAVAALAFAAAGAVVLAQQKHDPQAQIKPGYTDTFTAASSKGFQAALDEAVQMGMKAHAGVADAMIEWELVKVAGRQGGIAGFNETSVTIRVTSGTPPTPQRGG